MENEFTRAEISAMRRSYSQMGLGRYLPIRLRPSPNGYGEASANPMIVEANAMVLSTVDHAGELSSRTVLLKDVSHHGFTFFTSYSSRKGKAIHSQPRVTLLFPWYAMERQVIINGDAQQIPRANLRSTSQPGHGRAKLVHGRVVNLPPLHREKS